MVSIRPHPNPLPEGEGTAHSLRPHTDPLPEEEGNTAAPGSNGDGNGDGRRAFRRRATAQSMAASQRDISRQRVLRQEPPPAGLRQSPQGPPDHRQGGGRQRPGRLRRGRHPARNLGPHPARRARTASRSACRTTGPASSEADPPDLRQAALRLEVPPPADEPRAAGHRHQRGRHVRPADHRQAGEDHVEGLQAHPGPLLRDPDRHQAQPAGDPQRPRRRRGDPAQRRRAGRPSRSTESSGSRSTTAPG